MGEFYFGSDLFSELDRLQRQMSSLFGGFPSSIRSGALGAFPAVNIGDTDNSVEIVAFAPGMNTEELDLSVDRGLLIISGERKPVQTEQKDELRRYAQERFTGTFRRVIELPTTANPDKVQARYSNGCLSISVGKREASKPRAITIQ